MNERIFTALIPIAAALLTGCATKPIALAPVGPAASERADSTQHGYLQVFTATQKSIPVASDDNTSFNLRTGYDIFDPAGKNDQFVANHMGNMDEWPDLVTLAAGNYTVKAQSSWCGMVTVPVLIENGKTTVIHLDDNWNPPKNTPLAQIVSLPNGSAVGWKP
jgi:hypothetical protein